MRLERLGVAGDGAIRRLTLTGGPLGRREALELASVATDLRERDDVHVVVLDSRGDDFCPGADLDPLEVGADPAAAIAALRQPVVVALRGRVVSVGLEIALAADIRVADPGTVCSIPDVARGRLPSWGGTQRLTRAVGRPEALRMLLLGEEVGAEDALRIGLVHRIADVDAIVAALLAVGPLALQYAKEAVLAGSELPMRDGLKLEADLGLLLQASRDRAEGIAAFLEKRAPTFEGH